MFALLTLLVSTEARADQCAWIPKATADAAAKYLQPGSVWASYCEPCGDTKPVYKTVSAAPTVRETSSAGLFEVTVDGQSIDLAYVFVARKQGDTKLGNLAMTVGCPSQGVSKSIALPPKG